MSSYVGLIRGKLANREISVKTKHGQHVPPDLKEIEVNEYKHFWSKINSVDLAWKSSKLSPRICIFAS